MKKVKKRRLIIAIDGPAGSGKSTTAKALAIALKVPFIDTGAMYRSVTLKAMQKKVDFNDKRALLKVAKSCRIRLSTDAAKQRVYLDGKDVSKAIRTPELTKMVFYVAQESPIRHEMVILQKKIGRRSGGVMEGRDIGTVVFPKADYKFYFDASPELRAKRRLRDLKAIGQTGTLKGVLKDILRRDRHDRSRKTGPLRQAKDAIYLDTTPLTIPQTVDRILAIIGRA